MTDESTVPDWVTYPEAEWRRIGPEAAGIDGTGFRRFLDGIDVRGAEFGGEDHSDGKWGAVLTRGGYLIVKPDERRQLEAPNSDDAKVYLRSILLATPGNATPDDVAANLSLARVIPATVALSLISI